MILRSGMSKVTIAHLTPHHQAFDPRIFFECRSLVGAGFDVVLVAPCAKDLIRDGVRVLGLPRYRNRLDRVTRLAFLCVWRALREKPAIFHLHDPEMIPWGLLLRLFGRDVVFDVHEDFSTAAFVRSWIPLWARPVVGRFASALMNMAGQAFHIIIAERYYERTFPHGTKVLNYARLGQAKDLLTLERRQPVGKAPRFLYTGVLTRTRGALRHLAFAKSLPWDARVMMMGFCGDRQVASELRHFAANDPRLELRMDESHWIPHEEILAAYRRPWTAGIALFPDTPHYREKELTKFFEYMAAGLPILCSNFPVWRELVEGNGVGICVDPEDPKAAAEAALWLHAHPAEARAMGERGRRLVRERFNWESQAEVLVDFYRRILDRAGAVAENA